MMSLVKTLRKAERLLAALGLFIMMIVISYSVINRFVFKTPLAWNEEFTRYVFVWVIMLGANIGIEENAHVGIEFFREKLPGQLPKWVERLAILICIFLCIYLVASGVQLTMAQSNQLSASLRISMAYVYAAIPVGFGLMGITYLEILVKMIRNEDLEAYHDKNKAIKFEPEEDQEVVGG